MGASKRRTRIWAATGPNGGYTGVVTVTQIAKPPVRKVKPPVPRYHYSLATVSGSQQANRMEKTLREQLSGLGLSFFAVGHEGGTYDVMGDSGSAALGDDALRDARAVAARIKKAS